MAPPKARTAVKRIQSEKEKKKARTSTNSLGTSSKDSLTVSSKDKGKARPSLSPAASFNAKDGPLLDVNDKKWDAIHKSTKEIMGKSTSASPDGTLLCFQLIYFVCCTVHLQDHNRVDNILRVFDLNPDFGPSIGL